MRWFAVSDKDGGKIPRRKSQGEMENQRISMRIDLEVLNSVDHIITASTITVSVRVSKINQEKERKRDRDRLSGLRKPALTEVTEEVLVQLRLSNYRSRAGVADAYRSPVWQEFSLDGNQAPMCNNHLPLLYAGAASKYIRRLGSQVCGSYITFATVFLWLKMQLQQKEQGTHMRVFDF